MYFYHLSEDRLIDSIEVIERYGTDSAIPKLGVYPLSTQPDYIPVTFQDLGNGTWYPVESYSSMQTKAIAALVATGMTEEEALAALS